MTAPTAPKAPRLHAFTGHDVPWLLRAQAERRADHPFIVFAGFDGPAQRWSYREFHAAVGRLARSLSSVHAIRRGEFVLLHMDNCVEFLLTWHALARIGAVAVTTNTRSSGEELAYFASHCAAVAAVTQPRYEALLRAAAPAARAARAAPRARARPRGRPPSASATQGAASRAARPRAAARTRPRPP